MYIAPTTSIQFFRDLGLSPGGENTFYFASTQAKDSFFDSVTRLASVDQCSYVRNEPYKIRVEIPIATLTGCGYMRYRNTSFNNKWFYAYVLDAEYINNAVTEITFSRDILMTWEGEYNLAECFVERMHTPTDAVGEWLQDEGIGTGDYVINYVETITPYNPVLLISTTSVADDATSTTAVKDFEGATFHGNMLSGSDYLSYSLSSSTDIANAIAFIKRLIDANKKDAIITLRIVPAYCLPIKTGTSVPGNLTVNNGGTFASGYSRTTLDGYTPRNNKCFSWPYITYEVYNGEGGANEYRPEMFANALTPSFMYRGVSFDICEAILIPQGYKRAGLNLLYDEALMMRDFPQASFNIDQYAAYIAQMSSGGGWLNVVGSVAKAAIGGAASGGLEGAGTAAGMTAISQILQLLQNDIEYDSLPPAVRGTANANIMSAMGVKSFIGHHKSVTAEKARSIDNFFTMYGYRVNRVQIPPKNNRPSFTYVKTRGCIVNAAIPASDARAIESRFDRGVRFWNSAVSIGNFSANNTPV